MKIEGNVRHYESLLEVFSTLSLLCFTYRFVIELSTGDFVLIIFLISSYVSGMRSMVFLVRHVKAMF